MRPLISLADAGKVTYYRSTRRVQATWGNESCHFLKKRKKSRVCLCSFFASLLKERHGFKPFIRYEESPLITAKDSSRLFPTYKRLESLIRDVEEVLIVYTLDTQSLLLRWKGCTCCLVIFARDELHGCADAHLEGERTRHWIGLSIIIIYLSSVIWIYAYIFLCLSFFFKYICSFVYLLIYLFIYLLIYLSIPLLPYERGIVYSIN